MKMKKVSLVFCILFLSLVVGCNGCAILSDDDKEPDKEEVLDEELDAATDDTVIMDDVPVDDTVSDDIIPTDLIDETESVEEVVEAPIFDLEVYFFDMPEIEHFDPTYTSLVYVANYSTNTLSGPFKGSSFPNTYPADPSATPYNTVVDKEHIFNNRTGHKGTTRRGLNIVDRLGRGKWEGRYNDGWSPSGDLITMYTVNVHSGTSDNGNHNSRGSHGCLTIYPPHVDEFFDSFGYANPQATTGDAEGGLYLFRESKEVTDMLINALKSEFNG